MTDMSTPNNGLEWYMACASFCVKNIFAIHLYMSNQFAKISFPVQTGLGIWLSFRTYYYIFKSEEDLTSLHLCYVLKFLICA